MSGLVSVPAPQAATPATVVADGWFPGINVADTRAALRLPEVVTNERMIAAIEGGILAILRQLAKWRSDHAAAGVLGLGDVDESDTVAGKHRLSLLWTRAVRFEAMALLVEQYRDVSATNEGVDRALERALTADDYRRDATHAVRDILGRTRNRAELI